MKRISIVIISVVFALGCFAQDIIVKKDGSIIQAKVVKVGTAEVDYKKWSNQDGPSYAIAKSDILAITYQNGESETFKSLTTSSGVQNSKQDGYWESKPDENNSAVLNLYNQTYLATSKIKRKNKQAKGGWGILNVTSNSVMSTDELEVSFERKIGYLKPRDGWSVAHYFDYYDIIIKNKSSKMLYIDKSRSTRMQTGGYSETFYTQSSVTNTQSNNSGIGVGGVLGGIGLGVNVGSTQGGAVTTNHGGMAILSVPPQGSITITRLDQPKLKDGGIGLTNYPEWYIAECPEVFSRILSDGELVGVSYPMGANNLMVGEERVYTEAESPYTRTYMLTYSFDDTFSSYSTMNFGLYLKQVFGTDLLKGWESKSAEKYIQNVNSKTLLMARNFLVTSTGGYKSAYNAQRGRK